MATCQLSVHFLTPSSFDLECVLKHSLSKVRQKGVEGQNFHIQILFIVRIFRSDKQEDRESSVLVAQCFSAPSRHMVLTRFPTLTGLVSPAPVLHPCFSLASSASCDAFTEQQTSFMEPGPCSTQARSSLGKREVQRLS